MAFPALDLFPGETLFPGTAIDVDMGLYSQPIECAANGLVLTATDEFGCDWVMDTLTGWYGSPASTMQTTPKQRGPGGWPGPRELAERTLTIAGYTEAPTPAACLDAMDRFNAAVTIDAFIFTVAEYSSSVRSVIAYRAPQAIDSNRVGDTGFDWTAQLQAVEPRKFGALVQADTLLPATSGGFSFPFTFPFDFDSTVVSGLVTLSNPGNTVGPVVLRIDGPVGSPRVTHAASGSVIEFSTDLVLGPGEWLEVDMENQRALANGQVDRAAFLTEAGWFGFEEGDNTYAFAADGDWPMAKLTVMATPAWA